MKLNRKSVFAISLAVVVAMMIAVGGGTIAYLKGSTEDEVNAFQTNKVMVELTETTGSDYNIIPGTSQAKDPKVIVDNTVDSYVYVEVTDKLRGWLHIPLPKAGQNWKAMTMSITVRWQRMRK